MELAQPKHTIWTLLKPVYFVLKISGLAAFSIEGDIQNGRIKTTKFDIFRISSVLLALMFLLYIKTNEDLTLSHTDSFLIDKGAYLVGVFNNFNVICGVLLYIVRKKMAWKIFRKLHEVDLEVKTKSISEKP